MTRQDEEREIREARTTADVMARLERVGGEATRLVKPLVDREGLGVVLILVDPSAPSNVNAVLGGGNLNVESMRSVVSTWLRMLRGATDADKVALR